MKNLLSDDIGKRIKKKRLEAGLTQSELCGEKITRNMLSCIENGSASPSLDTLVYLANRLDISPAFFLFCSDDEEALYNKTVKISQLRLMMKNKLYAKAAVEAEIYEDDEIRFIKAVCEAHCALDAVQHYKTSISADRINAARANLSQNTYSNETLEAELHLINDMCRFVKDGTVPTLKAVSEAGSYIMGSELHTYIAALSAFEYTDCKASFLADLMPPESPYREYLAAKELVRTKQYSEAIPQLRQVVSKEIGALVTLPAMKDLELCYYETGCYKEAYEISKKKKLVSED